MSNSTKNCARQILEASTAVLKISAIGGRQWKRNVARGARIGPWLQASYDVLDRAAWAHRSACLYLVAGSDLGIRYVGMSRNGLKHRWRTSPAYDAVTMERLPKNQLFHSQCWRHIEQESAQTPGATFEVRVIAAESLVDVLERLDHPISAFATLRDDGESVVASVERWMCNNRGPELAVWNVAMTK